MEIIIHDSREAIAGATPSIRAQALSRLALTVRIEPAFDFWLEQSLSKEQLRQRQQQSIPSSACGVFIHGCEDEFEIVRIAAVGVIRLHAMCELSLQSQNFAIAAFDFLIDMFNDEMQRVRLTAIRNLKRIGHRFPLFLNENQLQTMLLALDDVNMTMRTVGYEIMG
ncbi:hypothetical protein HK100_003607 [Physocladia obscura]|uniref:HEAT repeat domain-containing protein n=1 Tax=Physocladia obscura TaxID=109957 RepID=A0AAD5XDG3_9FUNG|nr:hypothetical protein HK100_003607 [Physocladia obscura]